MTREDLGFVLSRFASVLVLLELLRLLQALPSSYALANMPTESYGRQSFLISIAVDLFAGGLAVLLWTCADRFGRSLGGKSKGGLRLTTRGAQRVMFSSLGLYLLAVGLAGLAGTWGGYLSGPMPSFFGSNSYVSRFIGEGVEALIGAAILTRYNWVAVLHFLRGWPGDRALEKD
jgi:hypothetical protein